MILFSILIFSTKFLDQLILNITYPFLEGSSQGKSVLLFGILGSILLLYPIFNFKGRIMRKISIINPALNENENYYLKFVIILVMLTYIIGILIEIIIRLKLGVSIFTTFVAMDPSPTSTSITHSHVFKSVLGDLISLTGIACSYQRAYRFCFDTLYFTAFFYCVIHLSTHVFIRFNFFESTTEPSKNYSCICTYNFTHRDARWWIVFNSCFSWTFRVVRSLCNKKTIFYQGSSKTKYFYSIYLLS